MKTIYLTHEMLNSKENIVAEPLAATIGMFDGLHRGHQALIQQVVAAEEKKVMFSFSTALLEKKHNNRSYLLSEDDKEKKLKAFGIDYFVVIDFTPEIMKMNYQDFIDNLFSLFNIHYLVVGEDFFFGANREGNVTKLAENQSRHQFQLEIVEIVEDKEHVVSSSSIKEAILSGDVATANIQLGYDYTISGEVIHGAKRGRVLGYPTVNMSGATEYYLPNLGVYVTSTVIDGKEYMGMTSIGVAPTVGEGLPIMVETNILDYSGSLYGEVLPITFHEKLRGEEKFASLDELVKQMELDEQNTRKYFTTKQKMND